MKKKPALKTFLLLLILPVFGLVVFSYLEIDLFAKTESQELEQLFKDMGVLQIPPGNDPIEILLKDPAGRLTSLSEYRGKIVFINFWTTWCLACVIEMPSMEKLHQKFKDRDFAMIAVNLQESASKVIKFFKEYKLTFTTLLDTTGDVGTGFGIRAIPTTLILDKNGRLIGKVFGPREWDGRDSFALFEYLTDSYVASSNSKSTNYTL
ncbi:MAG: TlpA family protein disulfide reductase [Desulfobacterales bacterium]|nr:TlpA family protein disulfide reductase [Desulfobacterales bacterium]